MIAAAALAVLLAPPARASEFLEALRRAGARGAKDPERVEFATRAIRAWTPGDGSQLLSDAYFRRAEGELEAYDDAKAEADLSKAAELDARNDRALLLRGRARLRLGRADAAEKDFTEYTSRAANDGEGWLGLAEARVARGLPRADKPALDAAARAAKLLPEEDARPPLAEGRAHLAAKRALKALDAFERSVSAGGDVRPDALSWRARAKAELGDARGARTDGGTAAEAYERRLADRRRAGAPEPAVNAARNDAAAERFRRGVNDEKLSMLDEAREDYRLGCELGSAPACLRADALVARRPAPSPKPAKKRKYRPNPKDDPGVRIYAN